MLSERNQEHKSTCGMIPFIRKSRIEKSIETERRSVVARGWEGGIGGIGR